MTISPGATLGSFEIVGHIGSGGMGEVYEARDLRLGRRVALKLLPQAFAHDDAATERLAGEARLLASLNHPNIATLYGFEEAGTTQFLVMELVRGDTLADEIARGPLTADEVPGIFTQIAAGLQAAHAKGVVHRDLKPANVKVGEDRRIKILDFGIAKALDSDPPESAVTRPGLPPADEDEPDRDNALKAFPYDVLKPVMVSPAVTRTGLVLGTPGYMSPEQAFGDFVGKPADVWAFGCCLFEALTGTAAFKGGGLQQLVRSIVLGQPDWSRLDKVPAALRDVVYDCLAKDPGDRTSFKEIIARLQTASAEIPTQGDRDQVLPAQSLERRLFDLSRDILCVAGLDGFLKRVNPAFERALGWTSHELYARPFIDFVHPDDRQATMKEMEKLGQGISTFSFTNRWECHDGRFRTLDWTAHLEPGTSFLYGVARLSDQA